MKPLVVWVGFTDGKPDLDALRKEGGISTDGYAVLYRTRKQARRYYQDVRKMVLKPSPVRGDSVSKG